MLEDKVIKRILELDNQELTEEQVLNEIEEIVAMVAEEHISYSIFTLKVNDRPVLESYIPEDFRSPIYEAQHNSQCQYLEVFDDDFRCYAWYRIPGGRI